MSVKLLTEHHLEFLSLRGGCTGLAESTLVKMPHCWKSHVAAEMQYTTIKGGGAFEIGTLHKYVDSFFKTYLRLHCTL